MKIYISKLVIFCGVLGFFQADAQTDVQVDKGEIHRSAMMVQYEGSPQAPDQFLSSQKEKWGLNAQDEFQKQSSRTDFTGIQRIKYQQYHNDLPVIGAEYILHFAEGALQKSSGYIFPHIDCNTDAKISSEQAKSRAIDHSLSHLDEASDFPVEATALSVSDIRLCIVDRSIPDFSGRYALAYECKVVSTRGAPVKEVVYVDASEGQLILRYSEICHSSTPTPASGYYYRDVMIPVYSAEPELFELRDTSRNIRINRVIDGDGLQPEIEIISNTDNNWTYEEEDLDGAAVDAMYCTAAYYDFMQNQFSRDGIDGENAPMVCNINVPGFGGGGYFYANAYWNGTSTNYGAGDCDNFGPFSSMSIVAHEFTHGLTDYTSDLIYEDESGALNESMSDIFGETLEFTADPSNFSWVIGSTIIKPTAERDPIRDMSDPTNYGDPKYYKGEHWSESQAVHTNSGVMNYWYYLIAHGAIDTNEVGDSINIDGMGIDKAIQIAYVMQTSYLTSTSDYQMAYESSISAAEDLYGTSSQEVQMVEEAWEAVGVIGREPLDDNLTISLTDNFFVNDACLSYEELNIDLFLENTGEETLELQEELEFAVQVGLGPSPDIIDTIFKTVDLLLFPQNIRSISLSIPNNGAIMFEGYNLLGTVNVTLLREDDQPDDNGVESFVNILPSKPNIDVGEISPYYNNMICTNRRISTLEVEIENGSCEPIPFDTDYKIKLQTGADVHIIDKQFSNDLEGGEFYTEYIYIDEPIFPDYYGTVTLSVHLPQDQYAIDDTAIVRNWRQKPLRQQTLNFNEDNEGSYLDLQYPEESPVDFKNDRWLAFRNITYEESDYYNCHEGVEDHYFKNGYINGVLNFCIDSRGIQMPELKFDAVLFEGEDTESTIPEDFATLFEVQIDSQRQALIYEQEDGRIENYSFDLPPDFVGNVTINVVAINRKGGTQHALGTGSWVLFDDIRVEDATAVESPRDRGGLTLYPNPAQSQLFLSTTSQSDEIVDVKVVNMLGQVVLSHPDFHTAESLNVHPLKGGRYHLHIIDDQNKRLTQPFVIQR